MPFVSLGNAELMKSKKRAKVEFVLAKAGEIRIWREDFSGQVMKGAQGFGSIRGAVLGRLHFTLVRNNV